MIDIHTHILPGVDDGAENFDEAFDMAVMAARCGVQALVATPHSNHDVGFVNYESDSLAARFARLRSMLQEENVPIQIYRGMEILASTDVVEKIARGKLLTLNRTRYTLVEFAFDEEPWWIEAILKEMLDAGCLPIIAHPERYFCVQEEPNYLYDWRKMGAFAQMNKESILGRLGRHAANTAKVLLKYNLINCLASDAHHAYARTTDMTALMRYMDEHFPMGYRNLLMRDNPRAILEG
jgi:protein-tyrosine phosphatase